MNARLTGSKGPDAPSVIVIMGPTASGKSALAMRLAGEIPLEIISADSALVYRGMDIGTAKPDRAARQAVVHHLVDIREPTETYSAAEFAHDAMLAIEACLARGRLPLLVGGTLLYLRALFGGLSPLPPADPSVRARLDTQLAEEGSAALHRRLVEVDPLSAQRIHPNDPQRIQRALEVYELTGKPLSLLWQEAAGQGCPYPVKKIILAPLQRRALDPVIADRFDQMLAQGLVNEVRQLRERGDLHPNLPSMRAVGYRQVWDFLEGNGTVDSMRQRAIQATRQLAKRQYTWLRSETNALWVPSDEEGAYGKVLSVVSPSFPGNCG